MKSVSIADAARQLEQLVEEAASGNEVVIQKEGVAVARIVRIKPEVKRHRRFGLMKGEFEIPDDFDAPLPDNVLADFEGR